MIRVGFALAAVLAASTAARAAGTAVPSETEARLAVAAYDRGAWRYQGVVTGAALSGHLALSITEAPDGRIGGEALLLSPDRHVLATSVVSGEAAGTTCRLDLVLGDRSERLEGVCSPQLIGGWVVASPPPADLVTRLVFWWGDRSVAGEAWLEPASGL